MNTDQAELGTKMRKRNWDDTDAGRNFYKEAMKTGTEAEKTFNPETREIGFPSPPQVRCPKGVVRLRETWSRKGKERKEIQDSEGRRNFRFRTWVTLVVQCMDNTMTTHLWTVDWTGIQWDLKWRGIRWQSAGGKGLGKRLEGDFLARQMLT